MALRDISGLGVQSAMKGIPERGTASAMASRQGSRMLMEKVNWVILLKSISILGVRVGKFCWHLWVKHCDLQAKELVLCNLPLNMPGMVQSRMAVTCSFLVLWRLDTSFYNSSYQSLHFGVLLHLSCANWVTPSTLFHKLIVCFYPPSWLRTSVLNGLGEQVGKKGPDICQMPIYVRRFPDIASVSHSLL